MTDLLEIYAELRTIRSRIDALEQGQQILIRAERERIEASLMPFFEADSALAHIYLQVDGVRGQREIAQALAANGTRGSSEASVSRKLDTLQTLDLVELIDRNKAGKVYRKTSLDRILRLSKKVEKILTAT
jgi:Fic family protein